eukprot:3281460-Amphidinium_carterae.2
MIADSASACLAQQIYERQLLHNATTLRGSSISPCVQPPIDTMWQRITTLLPGNITQSGKAKDCIGVPLRCPNVCLLLLSVVRMMSPKIIFTKALKPQRAQHRPSRCTSRCASIQDATTCVCKQHSVASQAHRRRGIPVAQVQSHRLCVLTVFKVKAQRLCCTSTASTKASRSIGKWTCCCSQTCFPPKQSQWPLSFLDGFFVESLLVEWIEHAI